MGGPSQEGNYRLSLPNDCSICLAPSPPMFASPGPAARGSWDQGSIWMESTIAASWAWTCGVVPGKLSLRTTTRTPSTSSTQMRHRAFGPCLLVAALCTYHEIGVHAPSRVRRRVRPDATSCMGARGSRFFQLGSKRPGSRMFGSCCHAPDHVPCERARGRPGRAATYVVHGPRTPVHMDLLCGRQQVLRSIYGASGSLLRPGPPVDRHVAPENPSS